MLWTLAFVDIWRMLIVLFHQANNQVRFSLKVLTHLPWTMFLLLVWLHRLGSEVWSTLYLPRAVASHGWSLPLSSVLKALGMWFRATSTHATQNWGQRLIQSLTFLSLLLFMSPQHFMATRGLFLLLGLGSWGFSFPALPCTSYHCIHFWYQAGKGNRETRAMEILPTLLEP